MKHSVGIKYIEKNGAEYFIKSNSIFYGGLLKNFSQTAHWIYQDFDSDKMEPIITIDLESKLYSSNTFLYEIAGIVNRIINLSDINNNTEHFDYFNRENHCKCCKGKGYINSFPQKLLIQNPENGFWDNMIANDVMKELKRYNFSKIKFLFTEIKKETNCNLNKSFDAMNIEEKTYFLYGYWESSFYDKKKQTSRIWKGLFHLVQKYLRGTTLQVKTEIKNALEKISCPICKGNILNHSQKLIVNGKELRTILSGTLKESSCLKEISVINKLVSILGADTHLNIDISTLDQKIQIELKLMEIEFNSFSNFEIVLNNYHPFKDFAKKYIDKISEFNRVTICDSMNILLTKKELLKNIIKSTKVKKTSLVYEVLGFKKVKKDINKIRKSHPCEYCKGKKVLKSKDVDENIDILYTPCLKCKETGISDKGLLSKIEKVELKVFELGIIKDLINSEDITYISNINLSQKIENLDKDEIINIHKFLEKK